MKSSLRLCLMAIGFWCSAACSSTSQEQPKVGGTGGTTGGTPSGDGGSSTDNGGTAGSAGSGEGGTWTATGGAPPINPFPDTVTSPRIMIVGDSISAGPGCYKKYLLQNLQNNGYSRFEFVGQYTDDCGGGVRHSAVSCTTSYSFTQATFTVPNCNTNTYPGLATLLDSSNPDLIMLQLGVNDVWGGSAPIQPILDNFTELLRQAREHNPRIVMMVAQIHKIITNNCSNAASTTNAQHLDEAIPGWAQSVSMADSPVLVADLWTNSDPHESDDCVHPNDAGAQRMGLNWYYALTNILPKG